MADNLTWRTDNSDWKTCFIGLQDEKAAFQEVKRFLLDKIYWLVPFASAARLSRQKRQNSWSEGHVASFFFFFISLSL